jgi:hypothetical protein
MLNKEEEKNHQMKSFLFDNNNQEFQISIMNEKMDGKRVICQKTA